MLQHVIKFCNIVFSFSFSIMVIVLIYVKYLYIPIVLYFLWLLFFFFFFIFGLKFVPASHCYEGAWLRAVSESQLCLNSSSTIC